MLVASVWDSPDPWIAVIVTLLVFLGLQMRRRLPVDLMFIGALVAVTVTGVITPAQALKNFGSPAVITIGGLLIVAAGLKSTGVLDWLGQLLLGNVRDTKGAMGRIAIVLVATSAFVLNTALVAMSVPVIVDWCRRRKISPSRLLIPVSYLAILGGVCTLIGTSTTLIVNGMLRDQHTNAQLVIQDQIFVSESNLDQHPLRSEVIRYQEDKERYIEFANQAKPLGLFEIGKVGLPIAIAGSLMLLFVAPKLLPDRSDFADEFGDHRREYLVEMHIAPTCRLVGKNVEDAGLRQLEGLFLIEISRANEVITPVTPQDMLRAGDRLVFSGVVSQIMDLEKIPGLEPIRDTDKRPTGAAASKMVEAVLSRTSPLIGRTIRDSDFRQTYDAAVVAVHRNGSKLPNKIGSIRLEAGDTLLLQTRFDFAEKYRNSVHFYLVSNVDGYEPPEHERAVSAGILGLLLILMLVLCSLGSVQRYVPMFRSSEAPAVLAVAVACLMILTRCVTVSVARASLNMQVLLAIVGALGLGEALFVSGAAPGIADLLVNVVGNQYLLLIVIYLLAMLFTELITNNAVAAILLPIAISTAWRQGCSPKPFIMAIALAASLSFLTPIGYQTNLMVMGPGGYVPRDYLKIGIPIAATATITALILIPIIWPF